MTVEELERRCGVSRVGRSVCWPRARPVFAVESGSTIDSTVNTPPKFEPRIGPMRPASSAHEVSRSTGAPRKSADPNRAQRRQPRLEHGVVGRGPTEPSNVGRSDHRRRRPRRPGRRLRRPGQVFAVGDRPQPAGVRRDERAAVAPDVSSSGAVGSRRQRRRRAPTDRAAGRARPCPPGSAARARRSARTTTSGWHVERDAVRPHGSSTEPVPQYATVAERPPSRSCAKSGVRITAAQPTSRHGIQS